MVARQTAACHCTDPRQRALNEPNHFEIANGTAQNRVLDILRTTTERWKGSPVIPLDGDIMKRLNFTRIGGAGSFGLLDKDGKISWPKVLLTLQPAKQVEKIRVEIETGLRTAYGQAIADKPVDPELLAQLGKQIDSLGDAAIAARDSLAFEEYLNVKRFLGGLDDAVTFLKQPDAGKFLGRAGGDIPSVQQLVLLMTDKRLQFAPSLPGNEEAYFKLYQQLVQLYAK